MNTSKLARPISFAVAVFAASACMGVHAEYRCTSQALPEEKRACELVKQGPDALRMFVDRTRYIYGLYFYDYVTKADADRWHQARHGANAQAIPATGDRDQQQAASQ